MTPEIFYTVQFLTLLVGFLLGLTTKLEGMPMFGRPDPYKPESPWRDFANAVCFLGAVGIICWELFT